MLNRKKNGSVMPAHVECAKRAFNMLTLLTKNSNAFVLLFFLFLILLVFPLYQQKRFPKIPSRWYYFNLELIWVTFENVLYSRCFKKGYPKQ